MEWTAERMDVLRTLWLEGRSSSFISKTLGVFTRNAVMGKVDRMGLMRSPEHNSRLVATLRGACAPAAVAAAPEPVVVKPKPIDPRLVRLSRGTVHKACAGLERGVVPDFAYAASLVSQITGQPFSVEMPGHRAGIVGIATMLAGDPRRLLCPTFGEPVVLGYMRRFASEGMIVGGKTPPRWCEESDGDASFFDDMLVVEDVRVRPEIVMRDPVASPPSASSTVLGANDADGVREGILQAA
jgi:hypothetical protein